jgi:hypothetical protein
VVDRSLEEGARQRVLIGAQDVQREKPAGYRACSLFSSKAPKP